MKKIIIALALIMMSTLAFAQQNTMKFLGIPIDGTKSDMMTKLKSKGFVPGDVFDMKGEFNGKKVDLSIQTVNRKVWRIAVIGGDYDEANIRIQFNRLLEQFVSNGKYDLYFGNPISRDTDISYEMTVNNKIYEACFSPKDESVNGCVWFRIKRYSGGYYITIYYENSDNEANGEDL